MKLGVLSAIYDGYSFEEMIDHASSVGYECVEVACWPSGKAERRYAGVSHIDVTDLSDEKAAYILDYVHSHGMEISAISYYPNPLDADASKAEAAIRHIYACIDASAKLGVNLVGTFIGRDQRKTVEENIELAVQVWDPILRYAKDKGVRIAIENCPMLFGPDQWPGGQNIFTSPVVWRRLFERLDYDNFGLNFDPSHFIWQQMDYVKAVWDFKDRIFHVHFKDIKLHPDKLRECGVMAYPLDYMTPKLPGLGDVDWGAFVSALTECGYEGASCVEIEDKAYEGSRERIEASIAVTYRYMRNFVI